MTLSGPNQLWAADITYTRLASEFVYLAVVLDVFSRKVISWGLERSLKARLVVSALELALQIEDHLLVLFIILTKVCSTRVESIWRSSGIFGCCLA